MALGIQETKEVLAFGFALGDAFAGALQDGDIDFADIVEFIPVLQKLGDAVSGLGNVPAELGDLSEVEYQELVDYVKEEFDLPNDKIEEYIEKGFAAGLKLVQFIAAFFEGEEEPA